MVQQRRSGRSWVVFLAMAVERYPTFVSARSSGIAMAKMERRDVLDPAFGIDSAYATAMSGEPVVGVSGNVRGAGTAAGPVAWRRPRQEGAP